MMKQPIETDALVIGAGPCGLFQVFQLGLQGISCCVVEALPHPGGQCAELYPDKPIYDIPGIPHILAEDLTEHLLQQIQPFNPTIHFGQTVEDVQHGENNDFKVITSEGQSFLAKHVILAAGAGAFTTVKMRVDGIDSFEDTQLFYRDNSGESVASYTLQDKQVVVTGDTKAAICTAIETTKLAAKTTYIHRKRRLAGDDSTLTSLTHAINETQLTVINGKITSMSTTSDQSRVTLLSVIDSNKETINVEADVILARLGNSPKLNNFANWGLHTIRNHVEVDPSNAQSNLTGFYVIGDINNYPGKRKLILCGFHEATLAAFDIAARLSPDKPIHTQYTTTSTELQKRLGVSVNR